MDLLVSSRLQVLVAIFLMGILFRRDERETYNGFFFIHGSFYFCYSSHFILYYYGLWFSCWCLVTWKFHWNIYYWQDSNGIRNMFSLSVHIFFYHCSVHPYFILYMFVITFHARTMPDSIINMQSMYLLLIRRSLCRQYFLLDILCHRLAPSVLSCLSPLIMPHITGHGRTPV